MGWREREKEREGLGQGGTREEKKTSGSIREREQPERKEGKREVSKGRRSEGGRISGVWVTDCPQRHQTINPPSPSKQIKAIYS